MADDYEISSVLGFVAIVVAALVLPGQTSSTFPG
jgi:hypothetical protein